MSKPTRDTTSSFLSQEPGHQAIDPLAITTASADDGPPIKEALAQATLDPRMRDIVLSRLFSSAAPRRIGRYRVLDLLGEGAMGRVYSAYDDQLDRKVAVKVVRNQSGQDAHERLLREARALARLSHANITTVHEVDEVTRDDGGREVFIAMEFVRGETLRDWLAAPARRSWREVLGCFLQAGAALAAAHEAGLVHRDFKPENTIVTAGGVLKVLDFGLARALDSSEREPPRDGGATERPTTLTRTGALMGTPVYMSPEQFAGGTATTRSDQFSFCVALYEALYGARPFSGASLRELSVNVLSGRRDEPPGGVAVPGWIARVLDRGLQTDPDARWPSMRALVDALADDPTNRRQRWLGIGLLALAVGGVSVALTLYLGVDGGAPESRCTGAAQEMATVWSASRQGVVARALVASGESYAQTTTKTVLGLLDAYAARWIAARTDACEDTLREEQSPALMDARVQCLEDRRRAVNALIGVFEEADAGTTRRAVELARDLPTIELCAELEYVTAAVKPPEDAPTRRLVARARDELARAAQLLDAGKFDAVETALARASTGLEALDYAPIKLELAAVAGELLDARGEYKRAVAQLEPVYFAARELRHDQLAARLASQLAWSVGYGLTELDAGERWAKQASAEVARGVAPARTRVEMLSLLGVIADKRSDFNASLALHDEALAEHARIDGDGASAVMLHLNRGAVYDMLQRWDEALADYRRALALLESEYGPKHPMSSRLWSNMGLVYGQLGRHEEAVATQERALALARAYFSGTTKLGDRLLNLGLAYWRAARYDDSEAALGEALEIYLRAWGPDHADVALARAAMGQTLAAQGRYEEALREHQLTLEFLEPRFGPIHREIASNLSQAAYCQKHLKRYEESVATYTRAVAIWEQLTPGGWYTADAHRQRGQALYLAQRYAEAEAEFERALELYAGNEGDLGQVGDAEFSLARALDRRSPGSARALELARSAYQRFAPDRAIDRGLREDIAAWLSARGVDVELDAG